MAPPSRPILAISADRSSQRYASKRAASKATGHAASTLALAATKVAKFEGVLWKFEDDPREVDMSCFQMNEQRTTEAPIAAELEKARDFADALKGDDGQTITVMRLSDGFVSATKLCQSAGKQWSNYKEVGRNIAFLKALGRATALPVDVLVQSTVTGPNHKSGTWVHPYIATHLAMWISTEFEIKIAKWIGQARQQIFHMNEDFESSLATLKARTGQEMVEACVRDRLAEREGGQVEVVCEHGIIDVLTPSDVIEVKRSNKYLHALGQILGYSESYPKHKKRVHLIMDSNEEELVSKAKHLYQKHGVEVTCEVVMDMET